MAETLAVHPPALRDLGILARRAAGLDGTALLRVRPRAGEPAGLARVFVTTPFGPLGCRSIPAAPGRGSMVVRADAVAAAAEAAAAAEPDPGGGPVTLDCGGAADASWPGALPPETGFELIDVVPAPVLLDLDEQARAVTRDTPTPLGPPASLLDQEVLEVADGDRGLRAGVRVREILALTRLGFIPAEPPAGEPVRVSARGRWTRVDGRFGTVFSRAGFDVIAL